MEWLWNNYVKHYKSRWRCRWQPSWQSVSETNCWTFGSTHHPVFHWISSILMFCWTLYSAELQCCFDDSGRADKRAGALVKLRWRGLRTQSPSIHLTNLRSLPNKTDKLLLLSWLKKGVLKLCCSVFHGNLAERHSRQRASLPNFQLIRSDHDAKSTEKSRDVLLHQWEVVDRYKSVKEDVQFWSINALYQLQVVLLSTGVLFVHSRECLHSSASAPELSFTETRWSDHRNRTKTTGLCFNHSLGTLIKQISPVNCQNTDSTSHVPPETVIYWITVIQR